MGNKEKGSNVERELLHLFFKNNMAAVRVAGSGSTTESSCDLIVGKKRKKFCIEVKSTKKRKKYLDKKQIENFLIFSQIFGLKPLIALRFNREGWFFLQPKYLQKTSKGLSVSIEQARKRGKRFGQIVG